MSGTTPAFPATGACGGITRAVVTIRLVCTGKPEFRHRSVTVWQGDGVPWNLADASLELRCRRCGQAPRPSGMTLRALVTLARDAGGKLDIGR